MFWGFSEALNFVEEYQKHLPKDGELPASLNILLFGSGDPRHVLATASKLFQNPQLTVHLYLVEGCIELIARHMLLVAVAFENPTQLSVRGKTDLFLDLFGNTLIRPFSSAYLNSKARVLTNIVTDPDYAERYAPIFDLEALKYKERDQLENVFHFWQNDEKHVFNIARYWDDRLRAQLGERYDHRDGAFDWDLQMRLRENGAKQICPQEYKHWRKTGVAFVFPEYEQSDPNRTFTVGLVRNGSTYQHRGSVGDNTTGPYISFGQRCPEERLMRSKHGVNDFRSTDITERNVHQIVYELEAREPYHFDPRDIHQFGAHQLDMGKALNAHDTRVEQPRAVRYEESPLLECTNFKLHFLSVEDVLHLQEGSRFRNHFDAVFVAYNYFSFLKDGFARTWNDEGCLLCLETRQLTTSSKEEITAHTESIKTWAKRNSLQPITNFAINKPHSTLRYKHQQSATGAMEECI
ncbi:dynein axonemal assembly factor 3 homolog [Anopheles aquasalis]|uniref:dynein axonemal assembly factor 3 homolog n=1 Tax=Anopheles aquasalis TaxID=42839 RepID=UPI00215AD835|nr:dynein axonemal assembly factor 3 homolog [Anopheles aquasalis]